MEVSIVSNKWRPIPLDMFHTMIFFSARDVESDLSELQSLFYAHSIDLKRPFSGKESFDAVSENSIGYCKYLWLTEEQSSDYYHLFLISINLHAVKTADKLICTLNHELMHIIQRLIQKQMLDGDEAPAYLLEYLTSTILRSFAQFNSVELTISSDSDV